MRGSDDRVREMRIYQTRNRWIRRSGWMGRMVSKWMLGLKLRSSEDVELFSEVLDDIIRDEEEGEDQIESSSSSTFKIVDCREATRMS